MKRIPKNHTVEEMLAMADREHAAAMVPAKEGFDLARILNICRNLSLSPNLRSDNDFARLADVLCLHGFLPSRDAF